VHAVNIRSVGWQRVLDAWHARLIRIVIFGFFATNYVTGSAGIFLANRRFIAFIK
jgi:hypothetical protein